MQQKSLGGCDAMGRLLFDKKKSSGSSEENNLKGRERMERNEKCSPLGRDEERGDERR